MENQDYDHLVSELTLAGIVDIEIIPRKSDTADLFVRSDKVHHAGPVSLHCAFQLLNNLVNAHGFQVLSSGKTKISQNERFDEMYGSLNTWFILCKRQD